MVSSLLLFSFLVLLSRGVNLYVGGATDTLGKGQNVTDGAKTVLVSAAGTFTMGFFSPGTSTKRYLGIWFSVSSDAVCWVANRDRPLNDASGVLLVAGDTGSLVLLDGSSGQVAWSSDSAANTSFAEAQLLDSGNLVVHDQRSKTNILWQSFDHPSNTMLPGMKVGKNLWTGAEWYLTSWRSPDDPAPGDYRRVLDTSGLPDNLLLYRGAKAYRTGPWNGRWFSGVVESTTYTDLITYEVTTSPSEITYMYTSKPGAALTRIVVPDTGFVRRLVWEASSRTWEIYFQGPRDVCDTYAYCGAFGICNANEPSVSFCKCLNGYSPASPSAWSKKDFSGGCRRNVALGCSSGGNGTAPAVDDGFELVRGVKLPDTHNASVDTNTSMSMEECRARCIANCSCLAYAAADIRGNGSGCIIWTDAIIDLRYVDRAQDLYLKLAGSEFHIPDNVTDAARRSRFPIVTVVAPVASLAAILVLFFVIWWRMKHKSSHGIIPQGSAMIVPSVDLRALKEATRNFSESSVIGQGAFGVVYKGQLPDGKTIAVKRLRQSVLTRKGKSDFMREVEVMARLRHANLVRLLAYCDQGDERILVYIYMPNKSLDLYIFGEASLRAKLGWRQRLDIVLGIAQGVAYMHEGCGESVVHRDLKPPNVLLDDDWKPKIADFGTAKLFVADRPESNLTIVVSPGYASPEYPLRGEMTLKCDVYSFGVVLLEALSGQRNGETQRVLLHAWGLWEQGRAMALLDSTLTGPDPEVASELGRCIQIGLLCVQESPDDRPPMSAVVAMLTTRSSQIDQPSSPGMYVYRTRHVSREADLMNSTTVDLM